jgi:hypothetical protein
MNVVINFRDAQLATGVQKCKAAQKKTLEGKLEFAVGLLELSEQCETVAGGTAFSRICKEELGLASSTASEWLSIGTFARTFRSFERLPVSTSALLALSKLPPDVLECVDINPSLTAGAIKTFHNKCTIESKAKKLVASRTTASDFLSPYQAEKLVIEEEEQKEADSKQFRATIDMSMDAMAIYSWYTKYAIPNYENLSLVEKREFKDIAEYLKRTNNAIDAFVNNRRTHLRLSK